MYVTGRPALWAAFKGLPASDATSAESRRAARELFERSGLRVRRVTWTRRGGRPYLFVSADFEDVNRLAGSAAFPDLDISLVPSGDRLQMEGRWRRPEGLPAPPAGDTALAELAARLDKAARRRLGRSLSIREVDAGSCNGCELEIHALGNAFYDLERFGLRFVASPRHADVLMVTGPVTRNIP